VYSVAFNGDLASRWRVDGGSCELILHEAIDREVCQLQGAGRDQSGAVIGMSYLLVFLDEKNLVTLFCYPASYGRA
jgi:hypothetical protein